MDWLNSIPSIIEICPKLHGALYDSLPAFCEGFRFYTDFMAHSRFDRRCDCPLCNSNGSCKIQILRLGRGLTSNCSFAFGRKHDMKSQLLLLACTISHAMFQSKRHILQRLYVPITLSCLRNLTRFPGFVGFAKLMAHPLLVYSCPSPKRLTRA